MSITRHRASEITPTTSTKAMTHHSAGETKWRNKRTANAHVIRTLIPTPLLPKNPQPTGDDDFRLNSSLGNKPSKIDPPSSLFQPPAPPQQNMCPSAQILLLPAAGLRWNSIHKSSSNPNRKSSKQTPDHHACGRPQQSKISYLEHCLSDLREGRVGRRFLCLSMIC